MTSETQKTRKMPKSKLIVSIIMLLTSGSIFIGNPLIDKYREAHPIDKECLIKSAEVYNGSSGTGGIATSNTELQINTDECGKQSM